MVAFVGSSATSVASLGSTTVAVNKPAGVVDGNLIVVLCYTTAASTTWTAPDASWTQFVNLAGTKGFWKIANADGASWTFTRSSATNAAVVSLSAWSGNATSSPIVASGGQATTNSTSTTLPSITPPAGAGFIGMMVSCLSNRTWTAPGTSAERYDTITSTPALSAAGGDETVATGSATGTRVWTLSGASVGNGGIIFAINAPVDKSVSETNSLSVSESTTITKEFSASDSGSLAASESVGIAQQLSSSDTASVSTSESIESSLSSTSTDGSTILLADPSLDLSSFSTSDDLGQITVDEYSELFINAEMSDSDSSGLTISESVQLFKTIVADDEFSVSVDEEHSRFVDIQVDDEPAVGLDDQSVVSLGDPVNASDSLTISLEESASIESINAIESSDELTFSMEDSSSVEISNYPVGTDESALEVHESVSIYVTVQTDDALSLSSSDESDVSGVSVIVSTDMMLVSVEEDSSWYDPTLAPPVQRLDTDTDMIVHFETETMNGTMVNEHHNANQRLGGDSDTTQRLG